MFFFISVLFIFFFILSINSVNCISTIYYRLCWGVFNERDKIFLLDGEGGIMSIHFAYRYFLDFGLGGGIHDGLIS